MKQNFNEEIEIPEQVTVTNKDVVIIKGPKGEVKKKLFHPTINIKIEEKKIILSAKNATKREKKLIYTYTAHLKNMLKGVQEPWIYKLKICAGHFPMNVALQGDQLIIKNFLGEKIPRTLKIKQGAKVTIDGKDITVESIDKEIAGNTASAIELITRVRGRDLRVFQDGIYITKKAGKEIK